MVDASVATKKTTPSHCRTPAPTPASPYTLYAPGQRCLEARPVSSFVLRRLKEDHQEQAGAVARRELSDVTNDCYRRCYDAGLSLPFYFATKSGTCYCCETWYVRKSGAMEGMVSKGGDRNVSNVDVVSSNHLAFSIASLSPPTQQLGRRKPMDHVPGRADPLHRRTHPHPHCGAHHGAVEAADNAAQPGPNAEPIDVSEPAALDAAYYRPISAAHYRYCPNAGPYQPNHGCRRLVLVHRRLGG
jgi:hypothetical protein